jgi:histidine ammonia-lyase
MLTIQDITDILFHDKKIEVTPDQRSVVELGYRFLQDFSQDRIIYGINTGFGPMAQYRIDDQRLVELQYNIDRKSVV